MEPWICQECGNITEKDLCPNCGAIPPFNGIRVFEPGAYGDIVGAPRTPLAARYLGIFLVSFLGIQFAFSPFPILKSPYFLAIVGYLVVRIFLWAHVKALTGRLYCRFRFHR